MLTGPKLGEAIATAIRLKIASGGARTLKEIAAHFRVKPPSLYDWMRRGTIDKGKLPELWRYFGDVVGMDHWGLTERDTALLPPEWPRNLAPHTIHDPPNASPGPPLRGRVPLVSWVQAGEEREAIDLLPPGQAEEWVETTVQVRAHTYALRVEGDSMAPLFPPGTLLVVEPELDAQPGDYVIAKNGEGEVTFKQLVRDGGDWYLKPLNERYPIKPLGAAKIIGVVREALRRFR